MDVTKVPLGVPSAILILLGTGLVLDADAWRAGLLAVAAGIACLVVDRRRRVAGGA